MKPHPEAGADVANTRRWVPWILAYTGARVSEITRPESKHIIREAGVWAIDIQQSKNGRPRLVPIHRDLVRQGFLDFVRQRDGMPLFFAPEKLKDDYLVIHKMRSEGIAEWARERPASEGLGGAQPQTAPSIQDGVPPDRDGSRGQTLYIQGHAFKIEGEEYGFFPVDITVAWMDLFPIYDVSGTELQVQRATGNDVIQRAISLLHKSERRSKRKRALPDIPRNSYRNTKLRISARMSPDRTPDLV